MKKLSSITILFLCICGYISSAEAMPITYEASGTVKLIDNNDPLGWGGMEFTIEMLVESNAVPVDIFNGTFIMTDYEPSRSSLIVGNEEQLYETSNISLNKYPDTPYDSITMRYAYGDPGEYGPVWDLSVSARYDYGALGNEYPIPPQQPLSSPVWAEGFVKDLNEIDVYFLDVKTFSANQVPEPATMLLLGVGLLGLTGFWNKRFEKN